MIAPLFAAATLALAAISPAHADSAPPSCAPTDDLAFPVIFQATTPNLVQNLSSPFLSVLCNGLECPGVLNGGMIPSAVISVEPFDSCTDRFDIVTFEDVAPLLKTVTLGLPGQDQFTVQSLQTTMNVEAVNVTTLGMGTVSLLSFTDVYFRAPIVDGASGAVLCPSDPAAGDVLLVETPFESIPAFQMAALPLDQISMQPLVCLYACTSLIIEANVEEPCMNTGSGGLQAAMSGEGDMMPTPAADVMLELSPLGPFALACDVAADLGPFVTPTTMFPATVNGVGAGPLCMSPGEQLGAFVGTSPTSSCCMHPPCEETIDLVVDSSVVEKAFAVQGIPVESTDTVSFTGSFDTLITQANFLTRFTLYQWTSTFFNCQAPDGTCPVDPEADIGPLAIMSSLSDFFDGVCPQEPNGLFRICVYACLRFKVVECVFSCDDSVPPQLGQLFEVEPMVTDAQFPDSSAQSISDPHFQGFRGQSYDFHGVAGQIYHLLSDSPLSANKSASALSVNARVDQAYSTMVSSDLGIGSNKFSPIPGSTWMTEAGVQVGPHCVTVSSRSATGAAMSSEFALAFGSIQVDGDAITRVGVYHMDRFSLEVKNMKSSARVTLSGELFALSIDVVPPPESWNVESTMVDDLTHINVKIESAHLRHGLGVIGMSALEKNSDLSGSGLESREMDFRMPQLCGAPELDRIPALE